jgi:hypothetical protein
MSSTCFEPESSFSGRRLYVRLWYTLFTCDQSAYTVAYKQVIPTAFTVACKHIISYTSTCNRLPEDEPSGSKYMEDIVKIKILAQQRCIFLVCIVRLYYSARCKNIKRTPPPTNFNILYIPPSSALGSVCA